MGERRTGAPDRSAPEPGRAGDCVFLRLGSGRPVVLLPGLSAGHDLPTGLDRAFEMRLARRYAASREVWWVQRPQHLAPGATMADIAEGYAAALATRLAGPVDVVGASTGGSVALQLALDHPDRVRRLAVVASACRLGPAGRDVQRRIAEALRAGRHRDAGALLMEVLGVRLPARRALAALGRLAGPSMFGGDVSDMLVTIDAEDAFDVTARLGEMAAPTLVVGGALDRFYGAELFRATAEGVPDGRLVLHRRKGHAGTIASPSTVEAVLRFLGG